VHDAAAIGLTAFETQAGCDYVEAVTATRMRFP
jgi:hypothetical protein